MKKHNNNNDIKAILLRFFISIFAILSIASLICGIEYSGSRTQFSMTGKAYDTISLQDIRNEVNDFLLSRR